jgi:hypothetical protein
MLNEVILRLRACCPTFQRRIGGTASFSINTQQGALFDVPYCFVVPTTSDTEQAKGNGISTTITEKFLTIVCVDNSIRREDGHGSAYDMVERLRIEIRNALVGWEPIMWANHKPKLEGFGPGDEDLIPNSRLDTFRYLGGQHLSMNTQRLWHSWEWETSFQDAPPKTDSLKGFRDIPSFGVQPVSLGKDYQIAKVTNPAGIPYGLKEYAYDPATGLITRTTNSAIPANSAVIVWFERDAPSLTKVFAAYYPDLFAATGGDPAAVTPEMFELISEFAEGTKFNTIPGDNYDPMSPQRVLGFGLEVKDPQ